MFSKCIPLNECFVINQHQRHETGKVLIAIHSRTHRYGALSVINICFFVGTTYTDNGNLPLATFSVMTCCVLRLMYAITCNILSWYADAGKYMSHVKIMFEFFRVTVLANKKSTHF